MTTNAKHQQNLDVYSDPKDEEQGSHAHEKRCHDRDEDFLHHFAREFGRGDFVDKEPGREKESDGQEDQGQVRVDGRVDRAGVPRHGFQTNHDGCLV